MGLFDKLEKRLESGVNNAFAKAFRAEVQPVELASALRRAMDDKATAAGKGKRPIVPNMFDIELSRTDHEQLTAHRAALVDELKASAAEHAETQRYTPGGPLTINFSENDELETGVFKVRPSIARQAVVAPEPAVVTASDPEPRPDPEPDPQRPPTGGFALPGFGRRKAAAPPPEPEYDEPEDEGYDEEYDDYEDGDHAGHDDGYDDGYDDPEPEPQYAPEPRRSTLAPSPAAPRSYRQRPYLDVDGDHYPLMGAITIIGRDDDVDVVLDDHGVSRRHSEIRVTNDGPHLVASLSDLGSTNGTFCNGEKVTSVHLDDGDRITVGRTSMIFRQGGRR